MVAHDRKKATLHWLTFSAYTVTLIQGEVIQANGLLFDGSHYALELGVCKLDDESVTLRCTGRIGDRDVPNQYLKVSLVPGVAVPLEMATYFSGSIPPLLSIYWEPSVQVCPGQTAVLVMASNRTSNSRNKNMRPSDLSNSVCETRPTSTCTRINFKGPCRSSKAYAANASSLKSTGIHGQMESA
jgi:hypothetical protein